MHSNTPQTRLLPCQTRLIHAQEGMRLRVVSGRLWLTQPNVAQDLFLGSGDCVDLMQDWVVIGADAVPRSENGATTAYSTYELQPLVAQVPAGGLFRGLAVKLARLWFRAASPKALVS
jgi:hypothetical protein